MFMRRRPLARAAMVGGTAYAVGRSRQASQQREADEQARLDELEARQSVATPVAPTGPSGDEAIEQLKELAQLKESGVLTQAEFDAQKQKLLQGM
jgi:Short C-terminal domain